MPVERINGSSRTGQYSLAQALVYSIFTTGGLTFSVDTPARPKTVSAVQFRAQVVDGQRAPVNASLAPTDPLPAFPPAVRAKVLTATQSLKIRIEVDSAGRVTYKAGNVGANPGAALMPRRSAGLATLGWIEIDAVAGGFTPGTTVLNSPGVVFFNGDPDLGGLAGVPPANRGISTEIISAP
jgi:hypothetical protein